jgi:hypothetical protein
MGKSIVDVKKHPKKSGTRVGRPPTARGHDAGTPVTVRLSADEIAQLDAWIAEQQERLGLDLSRPAAIRAFIKTGLKRTGSD